MNKLPLLTKGRLIVIFIFAFLFCNPVFAQENSKPLYEQIKNFSLNGGKADVSQFVLKRDRAIKLPRRPQKVELDPQKWVLSEKTSTKGN